MLKPVFDIADANSYKTDINNTVPEKNFERKTQERKGKERVMQETLQSQLSNYKYDLLTTHLKHNAPRKKRSLHSSQS